MPHLASYTDPNWALDEDEAQSLMDDQAWDFTQAFGDHAITRLPHWAYANTLEV